MTKPALIRKIKSLKWRYISQVPDSNLYYLKNAEDFVEPAITIANDERLVLWHNACNDTAETILVKDMLFNE